MGDDMGKTIALDGKWQFVLDRDKKGIRKEFFNALPEDAENVFIPHTYNCGNGTDTYRGTAWYQYMLDIPAEWSNQRIAVRFDGIYRDADFWLNGVKIGRHYGAGFTTFKVELTDAVRVGEQNRLTVRVDNSFSPYALPWYNQFDWADDGGIFRPAYLEAAEKTSIDHVLVDALPSIEGADGRVNAGPAEMMLRISMAPDAKPDAEIAYELLDEGKVVASGRAESGRKIILEHVQYWHFDAPQLYVLRLMVSLGGEITDVWENRIGFRSFTAAGREFVLNGEKIHTVGTEWMPGSDPRIGNAERPEDLARVLRQLKETNCIYTRVHWQQDESFYDWCDEHGMMVQEEVPTWGCPKEPVSDTLEMVKSQLEEMWASHYNHPSIVSWGVGNELNGQSEVTKKYVEDAVTFAKTVEKSRPISYVSNTTWESPDDACNRSDIMMCNEYIGTWHQGYDNEASVRLFREINSDKPMLISEFGLCEPAFAGGDERREKIFLKKVDIYRRNDVTGFIYFCLNDYRTQMGEDGEGRFCRRVHGSTDFYGNPKPSLAAVTRECAPIKVNCIAAGEVITAELEARNDLPRYRAEGYYLELQATGKVPQFAAVPDINPGEKVVVSIPNVEGRDKVLSIHRPNGDEVLRMDLQEME